jgi:hypothetical protein
MRGYKIECAPVEISSALVAIGRFKNSGGQMVRNHWFIRTEKGVYLQSYNSLVIFKTNGGQIYLDKGTWDYSQTTARYRRQFLGEAKAETVVKIKSGEYKIAYLNVKPPDIILETEEE